MYPLVHGAPASKRISIAGNIRRGKQRPELWRENRPDTPGCLAARENFVLSLVSKLVNRWNGAGDVGYRPATLF